MKIAKGALNAGLFILVLLVTSCPAHAQQISRGGTIVVDLASEPTVVDPLTTFWNAGFVAGQLFSTLIYYDNNGKLQPGLVTKWSIDQTQGTYTFELRTGVLWHDGQPFSADDVKFSFENIISKYGVYGATFFKNVTVTTQGNTVVIRPATFLPGIQLQLLADVQCVIYPKHILQGQDFLKSSFRTTNPIGTGPFKMKNWVKGSYMELVRNENYWNGPYLDGMVIKFISDPAAIIAGLKNGEIHFMFRGIPYEAYDTLKQEQSLNVVPNKKPPYMVSIWNNVKAPYMSDVNVRQAIAYALDKTDITLKATNGLSSPIQARFDPDDVPLSPTMTIYNRDPAKANSILDAAGYKKGSDGLRFSLELLTRKGEPDEQLLSQLVKDELADIGINLSIKTVDYATWTALDTKFQYQMATIKMPIDIKTPWVWQNFATAMIGKGALTNNFQYSNPKLDQLIDSWFHESNPDNIIKILQQAQDILSQDLPEFPLYQISFLNVVNKNFVGPDIPQGKGPWMFVVPIENTYSLAAQPKSATTTAPSTTVPSVAPSGGLDVTTLAAVVVILLVIVGAWMWVRRRRTRPKS
jgi:peptide/nickel transport system substrate-binding protein